MIQAVPADENIEAVEVERVRADVLIRAVQQPVGGSVQAGEFIRQGIPGGDGVDVLEAARDAALGAIEAVRGAQGGQGNIQRGGVIGVVEGVAAALAVNISGQSHACREIKGVVARAADQVLDVAAVVCHHVGVLGDDDARAVQGKVQVVPGGDLREVEGIRSGCAGFKYGIHASIIGEDVAVVTTQAGQRVISGAAGEDVVARVANQGVVACATGDVFEVDRAAQDIGRHAAIDAFGQRAAQVYRNGRGVWGVVQGVAAALTVNRRDLAADQRAADCGTIVEGPNIITGAAAHHIALLVFHNREVVGHVPGKQALEVGEFQHVAFTRRCT